MDHYICLVQPTCFKEWYLERENHHPPKALVVRPIDFSSANSCFVNSDVTDTSFAWFNNLNYH